jgi:hypothetical protein
MIERNVYPLVPADAGTQSFPHSTTVRFGKVWIPASPEMNGCGKFLHMLVRGNERGGDALCPLRISSHALGRGK